MSKLQPPNIPFVEAHLIGPKQKPTAIVIDLSMTTSEKGAALGIATRLHKADAPSKSYHYVVDEAETYQGVWGNFASYGTPYRSISVLVCADAVENPRLWQRPTHASVLHRTAELVAHLALTHKIKPVYLAAESKWMQRRTRRRGGIIVRVPGAWPYQDFQNDVRIAYAALSGRSL